MPPSAGVTGDQSRQRRPRGLIALIVVGVLLILLVVAFFAADAALRSYAEDRIEGEIRDRLPSGVSGAVDVRVGGASFLVQYLSGTLEQVNLDAPDLAVNGLPMAVSAVATGVPVDTSQPIEGVVGTVRLTEEAVNDLVAASGVADVPADIRLGDGEVGYASSFRVLGFDLEYDVTAEPRIQGDSVVLTPTGAELTSAPGGLDLGGVLGDNLGSFAVPVCVAEFLPTAMTLTGLGVSTDRLDATLEATDLMLSEQALESRGSCSSS
jgi:hypothetical protein